MKTKRFAPLLTLLILLNAAFAHAYSIQVTYNTNLRAAPSLQNNIVETAAAGATLDVIGSSDGWLRINRNGVEVWMSKSVSYTRVEGGENAAPRTGTSTQIDNCCFVDRQCTTDEEWVNGYNAYQHNQCPAPSRQQPSTTAQSQPQPGTSEDIDNCCFIGWQCDTDEEWVSGFWAFQRNNQCAAPSQQRQQGRQQRQHNSNQQQSRQQQQSPQEQQEPKKEDPSEKEPSGDLIFIRLTEEEWREARCDIFGGSSCD